MLSYNVAGLLRSAPGESRTYPVYVEALPIADDLQLAAPITGELRLSRTGRSVLAKAHLDTALLEACSRCLAPVATPISVDIHEEALPSVDLDSGRPIEPDGAPDALRLDEHHELDLGPSVREAISLAEPFTVLCRRDCRGLCLECGVELDAEPNHSHRDEWVDPRLAALVAIRERLDA